MLSADRGKLKKNNLFSEKISGAKTVQCYAAILDRLLFKNATIIRA